MNITSLNISRSQGGKSERQPNIGTMTLVRPHIIEHDVNVVVSPTIGKGAFTPNVKVSVK
jgi:hypothetical protein